MSRPAEPGKRDPAPRPPSPTAAAASRARTAVLTAFPTSSLPASTEPGDGGGTPRFRHRAAQRLASQHHLDGPARAKPDVHATSPSIAATEASASKGSTLQKTRRTSTSADLGAPAAPPPPPPPSSLEALRRGSSSRSGVTRQPSRGATHPARPPPSALRPTAAPSATALAAPASVPATAPTRSPQPDVQQQSAETSLRASSEARSRIASLPRSARSSRPSPGGAASPSAPPDVMRHLTHFHADAAAAGGHANLAASGSTNSRGSARSMRHDTPSSIILSRHRPRIAAAAAAAALPTEQLLADGYYFASDESANSSFSDTPRSAPRMSLGSSCSIRTPVQPLDLNGGGAVAGARLAGCGAAPSSRGAAQRVVHVYTHGSSSEGSSEMSSAEGGNDDDDEDAVQFDEEDEEQAVLSYMDSAPEGNPAAAARVVPATRAAAAAAAPAAASSSFTPSPPLPRYTSVHPGAVPTHDGFGSDRDEFHVGVNVGEADHDIGENPPSRASAGPTPPLRARAASSARNSARSAYERRPSTPTRRPNSGGKSPAQGPASRHPSGTVAPTSLSRQHSTLEPAASRRHSPVQPGGEPAAPAHPLGVAVPPSIGNEEETRERQCKQLSLHEAFFANQSRSVWLVDDHVVAKVLEFVRIMGYEHPALRRDRAKGQSSLWSSSSAITSPIAPGRPRKRAPTVATDAGGRSPPGAHASQSAAAEAVAEALAQPASVDPPAALHGAGVSGAAAPSPSPGTAAASAVAKQFHLKSGRPRCAGQYVNTSTTTGTAHLFLTFSEAMRWIAEQEYVIGTVLLCCARFVGEAEADGAAIIGDGIGDNAAWHPRRALLQRGKPCIPLRSHPIHFVASLVCSRYPHWGGMAAFTRAWETQIRLVLGSAAPPHQRHFKCIEDGLLISSDFEAGNLHRVERAAEPYFFLIWLDPDQGSDKRIWFRFAVTGAKEGRTLRFRLMNAAPHTKLYRQNGMMPVWRDGLSQPNWGPVDNCTFRTTNRDLDGEVCFSIGVRNSTETIQVAFCAPYTNADLLCHVCHWHALVKRSGCDMRFEERVLCRSLEGRKLHLLIITSRGTGAPSGLPPPPSSPSSQPDGAVNSSSAASGKRGPGAAFAAVASLGSAASSTVPGSSPTPSVAPERPKTGAGGAAAAAAAKEAMRGPYANFATGKKVVLISGRVHPGEVTASHGVHGLISFLLSSDVRAIQLREHFIFFIVPMLNPDGVSRGHSRMDQYGNNLNRCYNNPDPETQPTVLALRHVFDHLQQAYRERFIMYLDFHSHASQSSGFIFGNNLPARVQHWNLFFPRLVELHARQVFSFGLCRFGRVHMTSKDGASRVLFGSSLIHSYTVELTHFTDRRMYADDFVAMNNGSGVLFEVTWPPTQPTGGSSSAACGEADGAGGAGGTAAADSGALVPQTSRTRAATPMAGARGAALADGGRRPSSLLAGRGGRLRRSNSEGAGARGSGSAAARVSAAAVAAAAAAARKRAETAGQQRGGRGAPSSPSLTSGSPATPPALQPIAVPSILCQSAEVGRACLLALRDYCAIGARPSPELVMFGGMERVLRDVKRQIKADSAHKSIKSQSAATYASLHPIYKQY